LGENRTDKFEKVHGGLDRDSHSESGNPILDAIHGNPLWGVQGVPAKQSLKVCSDGGNELHSQKVDAEIEAGDDSLFLHPGAHLNLNDLALPQIIANSDVDDTPEGEAKQNLRELEKRLRDESKVPFSGSGYYIPISSIDQIMSQDTIKGILPCIAKGLPPSQLDILTRRIFGTRLDSQRVSFRKILSVLVLIGKSHSILDFVKATEPAVSDFQLPLQKTGHVRGFQLRLESSNVPLDLFASWESRDIESFEMTQWEVLAPFFSRGKKEDSWVTHFELSVRRPLPFEIMTNCESRGDAIQTIGNIRHVRNLASNDSIDGMAGAQGVVKKVRIHADHHDLPSHTVSFFSELYLRYTE
jgi:hypothetical protein